MDYNNIISNKVCENIFCITIVHNANLVGNNISTQIHVQKMQYFRDRIKSLAMIGQR